MFNIDQLRPEVRELIRIFGGSKDLTPSYRISLVINQNAYGNKMQSTVMLNEVYKSAQNAAVAYNEYRNMSLDDLKWCLMDYPIEWPGKIETIEPKLVS